MNKTNRELNQEHDQRELNKVRPKQPEYQYAELEAIVNRWIRERTDD
jgi:hypothetical protein